MRRRSGFGWLQLVIGIILMVLGVLAFADPDLALTSLVFAYGVTAVVMGVADILLYIEVERYTGFGPILSLVAGILSVMSGVMLSVYPKAGVLVLTVLFPIWFIAHCISRLTQLNRIRYVAGNGVYTLMLVINIAGLILGCLMCLQPLFTLASLRGFAALYLLLLGIDAVVMALSRMGTRH